MLTFVMAIAAAAATPTLPPQPYDAKDEVAARAWIARAGHSFDPAAILPTDLAPIIDRLKGAHVIGIGEVTHGTHEDQAFKAELVKALVRAGAIDTLAIECNRAAGVELDRYVTTGAGDPAAIMRSQSFFSIWRDDEFGGLVLWLRAWNQVAAKPVRIVGIDDQDVGVDAAFALAVIRRHDAAAVERLTSQFGSVLGENGGTPPLFNAWITQADATRFQSAQAAAAALRDMFRDAPAAWRADAELTEAREAAERAWQGFSVFDHEYRGATPVANTDVDYYARRDDFMATNLSRVSGNARVVLWAHDGHVMWSPWEGRAGPANLGTFLHHIYGTDYRALGFSWSKATIHAVSLPNDAPSPPPTERIWSDIPLQMSQPGDLAHVFAPLPANGWWIDMATRPHTPAIDRWSKRPLTHGFAGWRIDPAKFENERETELKLSPDHGFDVLVWFRTMSPARSWPRQLATK